jgi:hypothetical protein
VRRDEYIEMVTQSFKRRLEIFKCKSYDYADQSECLGNFKRVAQILKLLKVDPTTSHGVAIIYIVLKMDRFSNLMFSGKQPKNESIQDTIDDLKNYVDLLEACLKDVNQKKSD